MFVLESPLPSSPYKLWVAIPGNIFVVKFFVGKELENGTRVCDAVRWSTGTIVVLIHLTGNEISPELEHRIPTG